ncbi:MAG: endonuclease MutS2, partial [Calditrichia bacterium]|nr:endonuclease MutS2 [Calditrichia bacterium]
NGEIYDNASPELKKVRNELFEKEKHSKSLFNRLLKKYKDFTQDDIVTLRDGRAVLAIQDIHYHKVQGIVHGTSGSEQTYYVEPLEALKISNEIQNLRIQERKIIVKILRQISGIIRDFRSEITYSVENLGNLDFIYAKAQFANKINGVSPVINNRKYYSIQNAKHPLLVLKMGHEKVVPLNLYLGDEARMLIVTGPNAGGKTVALKTIGLIQLLTQCGFLSPVDEGSELPLVQNIFVDIGDNQSIEKDLSTFSSHVVNIKNIVAAADEESLILMDELGASTDPEEGAALGMALIEWMIKNKMYGIVTTHLGKIKVYASEKEGVENGSMEFDMDNITPTYRLQIGIPGASYAFHIAKRYGLSDEIIDMAKGYLGQKKHSIESLIISLNENIQKYSDKMKQVSIRQSEVEGLKGLYETRASALKIERQKIRKQASEEMNEYLRKVRLDMENTIKELKEMKKSAIDKNKISEARRKLQEEQNIVDKE